MSKLLSPSLTLGVEEEYQIIDPVTRDLKAGGSRLIESDLNQENPLNLKPEFMESQIELGSHVCKNVKEVRYEIVRMRRYICKLARENNLRIISASSHPFAKAQNQAISQGIRYKELLDDMQGVARSLLIFGMHVHVGFDHKDNLHNKNLMIEIMNQARYFIPHLLALSTSSPFWEGEYTGLRSYRSVVFEQLPRTGIPPAFTSWGEYHDFESLMMSVGAFGKKEPVAKIWWDIRPHPVFDTLEFRISDACTTVDETVCLVALYQAICAKLIKLRRENMSWRQYRHIHIAENKWRAVRYGINGELIDFGRQEEIPFHFLVNEILEFVDDVVDDLGSRAEVEYVHQILNHGSSADRQIAVYKANGGDDNKEEALKAVVDYLIDQTEIGLG